jgi:hypothetical protein
LEKSAFAESKVIQTLVAARARSLQMGWTPGSGRQASALSTLRIGGKIIRTTKGTKAFFITIFVSVVFFGVGFFRADGIPGKGFANERVGFGRFMRPIDIFSSKPVNGSPDI